MFFRSFRDLFYGFCRSLAALSADVAQAHACDELYQQLSVLPEAELAQLGLIYYEIVPYVARHTGLLPVSMCVQVFQPIDVPQRVNDNPRIAA